MVTSPQSPQRKQFPFKGKKTLLIPLSNKQYLFDIHVLIYVRQVTSLKVYFNKRWYHFDHKHEYVNDVMTTANYRTNKVITVVITDKHICLLNIIRDEISIIGYNLEINDM